MSELAKKYTIGRHELRVFFKLKRFQISFPLTSFSSFLSESKILAPFLNSLRKKLVNERTAPREKKGLVALN